MTRDGSDTKSLTVIANQLLERVGLDYRGDRLSLLASSVRQRMLALGLSSVSDYVEYLQRTPAEWDRFVDTVTVTETSFYRDPKMVEAVIQVLSDLHRTRPPERPIHIWSTATAEGQEAYTLAMAALASHVAQERPVVVWGTDVNAEALARAQAARYTSSEVMSLPPAWQRDYLEWHDDGTCSPTQEVRALVRFLPYNLKALLEGVLPPFTPDVIVCANVLIYFPPDLAKAVMRALGQLLPPDGVIFFDRAVAYLAREMLIPVRVRATIGYRATRAAVERERPRARPRPPAKEQRIADAPSRPRSSQRRQRTSPARDDGSSPSEPCAHHEKNVIRLLDIGEWEKAEAQLSDWRAQAPLDARPHFLLARLYRMQGRWEEARVCYERALYLRPSFAIAHLEYGNLLRALGDMRGAQRAYRRALRAAQNDTDSHRFGFPPALVVRLADRALRGT